MIELLHCHLKALSTSEPRSTTTMKNLIRFLPALALGVGLALSVTGCSTVSNPQPPPYLPGPPQPQSYGGGSRSEVQLATVDPMSPEMWEAVGQLNISLKVTDELNLVDTRFDQSLRGRLATSGFTFIPGEAPDLLLAVAFEPELFDRAGNYYLYKGTADAELRRCVDGKLLTGNSFAAKGERKLGQAEALRNLRGKLVEPLEAWVGSAIKPEYMGIAASELTLALSFFKIFKGRDQDKVNDFINRTQSIPGVIYCRLLSNDPQPRIYRFRVVYYPEKMPEGLANAVAKACGYPLR
jgi:hypothetical protein